MFPFSPYGMVLSHRTNRLCSLIKGNFSIVLIHNIIVNRHRLLCDADTVSEQYKRTAAIFVYYSLFVNNTVLFIFWGALIVVLTIY